MSIWARTVLFAAAAFSWLALSPMTAAGAHSGTAVFETLEAKGRSDLVIDLRLRVRYSEDQEPADRAFLSVTPTSPDGHTLPRVDLERETGGVYRGAITVDGPGTWTLAISSAFPPGSTTLTVDVGDEEDTKSTADSDGRWFAVAGVTGAMGVLGLLVIVVRRRRR